MWEEGDARGIIVMCSSGSQAVLQLLAAALLIEPKCPLGLIQSRRVILEWSRCEYRRSRRLGAGAARKVLHNTTEAPRVCLANQAHYSHTLATRREGLRGARIASPPCKRNYVTNVRRKCPERPPPRNTPTTTTDRPNSAIFTSRKPSNLGTAGRNRRRTADDHVGVSSAGRASRLDRIARGWGEVTGQEEESETG